MRYAIYGLPHLEPLRAFAEGLSALGRRAIWRNHNAWAGEVEPGIAAIVVYGVRPPGDAICRAYAAAGAAAIVIDHGYLQRVHGPADYAHGYFQIGMGGLGWRPEAAPADRRAALGVAANARPQRAVRRVLICGQVAGDAQHGLGAEAMQAAYAQLGRELAAAGAQVWFRRHPLCEASVDPPDIAPAPGAALALAQAADPFDAVASLNSNAGLEALIAGIPAVTTMRSHYDECAYRWPVRLDAIEAPPPELVNALLQRLAYAQWTAAEMTLGLPQRWLMELGEIP